MSDHRVSDQSLLKAKFRRTVLASLVLAIVLVVLGAVFHAPLAYAILSSIAAVSAVIFTIRAAQLTHSITSRK